MMALFPFEKLTVPPVLLMGGFPNVKHPSAVLKFDDGIISI
nr:MAG TPA: hypothetical protein [Inoviridae sp.]